MSIIVYLDIWRQIQWWKPLEKSYFPSQSICCSFNLSACVFLFISSICPLLMAVAAAVVIFIYFELENLYNTSIGLMRVCINCTSLQIASRWANTKNHIECIRLHMAQQQQMNERRRRRERKKKKKRARRKFIREYRCRQMQQHHHHHRYYYYQHRHTNRYTDIDEGR